MHTLARLDDDGDFQAVTSGSRALFEVAVDLALLTHDPKSYSVEKVVAWEQSAKLMQAEKVRKFYAHKDLPEEHAPALAFAVREAGRITAARLRLWPNYKGRHPERWTGKPLPDDAEHADRFGDFKFRSFYADRFSPLCWSTHGSGLAGVRLIPASHFPGLSALAFRECATFAFHACQLALDYFPELRDDASVTERFRLLAMEGSRVAGDVLRGARATRRQEGKE